MDDATDYNYLDLNTIQLGVTKASEIIALLEQGGGSICASLSAGALVQVDACNAKIGNFAFEDANANGVFDAGELGIPDVPVTLTGTTEDGEALFFTTTTDINGRYEFGQLPPGSYKLTFTTIGKYILTAPDQGNDETIDSDANPDDGSTVFEVLSSGENNDTYDAGFS